jgi:hypothetical protein
VPRVEEIPFNVAVPQAVMVGCTGKSAVAAGRWDGYRRTTDGRKHTCGAKSLDVAEPQ